MSWESLPFDSKDEAYTELRDKGLDEEAAEKVAETLAHEVQMEEGQPESLWQSIVDGAKNIISDLNLETFSWVENPAQRSSFVMMKNENGFETSSPILKESKDDDWDTVYAPVMVPGEKDKDEEAIPAHVIESSAHEFLAEGKVEQIDSDHNLITGKGTLVESWILKEDKEYNLPDGGTETYPQGSWMVGVQPSDEAKERIESGELQGFSIFGEAEKVKLAQTLKSESAVNGIQEDNSMGENDETVDLKQVAESIESVKQGLDDLSETVSDIKESEPEVDAKEVSSFEELKDAVESGTELIELQEDVEIQVSEEHEEDDEEDEDEEKEAKMKGSNGDGVRNENLDTKEETESGGMPSYKSAMKDEVAE